MKNEENSRNLVYIETTFNLAIFLTEFSKHIFLLCRVHITAVHVYTEAIGGNKARKSLW